MGLEAAQLTALTRWLLRLSSSPKVRLETSGMRSQATALIASSLQPTLVSEIVVRQGIKSLGYLLEKPVHYRTHPDLFCLDLYKYFDLDRLAVLTEPARASYPADEGSLPRPDVE